MSTPTLTLSIKELYQLYPIFEQHRFSLKHNIDVKIFSKQIFESTYILQPLET